MVCRLRICIVIALIIPIHLKSRADYIPWTKGNQYFFSVTLNTWEDAIEKCKGKGFYLAKIENEEETQLLINHSRITHHQNHRQYWIGLGRSCESGSCGNWQWSVDKTFPNYTNWGYTFPVTDPTKNSVSIAFDQNDKHGVWRNEDGTQRKYYICEEEFRGPVNPCLSDPCKHGGQCSIDRWNMVDCNCRNTGYMNPWCDTDIDECKPTTKLYYCRHGHCENLPGTYNCICNSGYTGHKCDTDIDECELGLDDCVRNQGVCRNTYGGYKCACNLGFEGHNCALNVDECRSNPCQNNGQCYDGVYNFTCVCPPGYTGALCET